MITGTLFDLTGRAVSYGHRRDFTSQLDEGYEFREGVNGLRRGQYLRLNAGNLEPDVARNNALAQADAAKEAAVAERQAARAAFKAMPAPTSIPEIAAAIKELKKIV